MNNPRMRAALFWGVIFLLLYSVFSQFNRPKQSMTDLPYSTFISRVNDGQVTHVRIVDNQLFGVLKKAPSKAQEIPTTNEVPDTPPAITPIKVDEFDFRSLAPNDPSLLPTLLQKGIQVEVQPISTSWFSPILFSFGPILLLVGFYFWMMRRQMGAGKGGPLSFGKSKARLVKPEDNKVSWDDVKGVDEAKQDLQEIVEFLKNPGKFKDVGGKIPKGVLLAGSPGCGKTHLSRALAKEAGANFFTLSGSDFVEMFVGVGASRVRDLFEQARKHAPAIIFIDEIDAVGRQRGAGVGGGNDEREQTLNALLVEMDGFEQGSGVVVIAATNRPDVLDAALLRPGRFDRQVIVPLPDIKGRTDILDMYLKNIPVSPDVNAESIARRTPGFSGADLANLVNEAAIFAARRDKKIVDRSDFEMAKDKIAMGAERRDSLRAMTEEDKRSTAYHEAGHAIVGLALAGTDPVHKVTIVPRGRALGVTYFEPERDQYSMDREKLRKQLVIALGGRVAEELFMGQMTTGASQDIKQATTIAKNMVTVWGMSNELGMVHYASDNEGDVFLGRRLAQGNADSWSDETQRKVDKEVQMLIRQAYQTCKELLTSHASEMHAMAAALVERETLSSEECQAIMGEKHRTYPWVSLPVSTLT
jgi:cell division protease FtsH